MTQESPEAAAAARVAGERAAATLTELHARLKPCFARPGPFAQARKYMAGLISDLPRKNGWTIAEHAGDATPDRTQRLLNHAVWDTDAAAGVGGGGRTRNVLCNLVLICTLRHTLIRADGGREFLRSHGRPVRAAPAPLSGRAESLIESSTRAELQITRDSLTPDWGGEDSISISFSIGSLPQPVGVAA